MDLNPQLIFFVGQAGRLRRAAAASRQLTLVANTGKLVQEGAGCVGSLLYVCVQVQAGSPVPLQARFSTSEAGTSSMQHNFVTDAPFFDTVISESESLFVQSELATTLLVQMVSFQL